MSGKGGVTSSLQSTVSRGTPVGVGTVPKQWSQKCHGEEELHVSTAQTVLLLHGRLQRSIGYHIDDVHAGRFYSGLT